MMVSIVDGLEYPQLKIAIEDVRELFGDIYDLNAIMNQQFLLPLEQDDRERRAELVAKKLGADIERLSSKICELTEFLYLRTMAQAA